jgi:hypothetical protein
VREALAKASLSSAALVRKGNRLEPSAVLRFPPPPTAFGKRGVTAMVDAITEAFEEVCAIIELAYILHVKHPPFACCLQAGLADDIAIKEVTDLRKPALFLRHIEHVEDLTQLLGKHHENVERIQELRPAPAKMANMAVVYFKNEESAMAAAKDLHRKKFDGERVSAVYRQVQASAVIPNHH